MSLTQLTCPNITRVGYYPWAYTCGAVYQPGQLYCAVCGKALPKS